jgi:Transposase DDE domain
MRRRRLRRYVDRLRELQAQTLSRDPLLMKLGAARHEAGRAAHLVQVTISEIGAAPAKAAAMPKAVNRAKAGAAKQVKPAASLEFRLDRAKLRQVRRREGRYLLRTNLDAQQPERLWAFYIQLTEVEQAFKELKHDLAVRPIFHRTEDRIEAHIFVAFLAYCLQVTLKANLRPLAGGLTPREVIAKFKSMQMVDVHIPTTDGRELLLSRYTQPQAEHRMLLQQLRLSLPEQPPPKITASQVRQQAPQSVAL